MTSSTEESKGSVDLRRPPLPEDVDISAVHVADVDGVIGFPVLARQHSIYSLTLDEIQSTVCEPGRTFGSMNMDEFLNNVWSAEEGHGSSTNPPPFQPPSIAAAVAGNGGVLGIKIQRQGSLSLPSPLCQKTVDEVWTEIHRAQYDQQHHHFVAGAGGEYLGGGGGDGASRQPTLGEMTLEDFLVKAGVVREGCYTAPPSGFEMGHIGNNGGVYHQFGSGGGGGGGGVGYVTVNGSYGSPPGSPVSSDGMVSGQVVHNCSSGLMEISGGGRLSRKRAAEGVVEKVVERRQRRMIKNRESAARSRARKQAYTVELEAELNLLKEENARLREDERRMLALKKKMILDAMAKNAASGSRKPTLRRCKSWRW